MALFSSAADTFVFSFLIRRFLFREGRSTTEMLPAQEAWRISLGKVYSPECVEGEFYEVRGDGVLGSCAKPCNPSYLTSLCNTAGLTSPALRGKERAYGHRNERALLRRAG